MSFTLFRAVLVGTVIKQFVNSNESHKSFVSNFVIFGFRNTNESTDVDKVSAFKAVKETVIILTFKN